jgi:hypothetical protein
MITKKMRTKVMILKKWWENKTIMRKYSRLSAVEADGCQVSRPLRSLQWLHSDCLRAQHENVGGGLAQLFGRGWREAAKDCEARIWEEYDSVLSMTSRQGRPNPSSSTTAALGPACARTWTRNRAVKYSRKWMGASRLECAEPHGGSPR